MDGSRAVRDYCIWKNGQWYVAICTTYTPCTHIHVPLVFTLYTTSREPIPAYTGFYQYNHMVSGAHSTILLLILTYSLNYLASFALYTHTNSRYYKMKS